MQLSRIDLNLFTIFDAIYREGGITSASKRLHLSQPAVSHALARLRELLGDSLFERHGNEMIPTPRARMLAGTMPRSYAEQVNRIHKNQLLKFPLDVPAMELFIYWHVSVDQDSANRWIRQQLRTVLTCDLNSLLAQRS